MPEKSKSESKANFFLSFFAKFFTPKKQSLDSLDEMILTLRSQVKDMSLKEKYLLSNVLQFYSKAVEDVMIPRSDIFAIKADSSLDELKAAISKNGHTRTLVYEDTVDNIVGFVHMKDVFDLITKGKSFSLKRIMRKHIITTPATRLIDLLVEMQNKRTHIAIVIDEYGSTDGMATIEDIIEAIVDKIEDEHDDRNDENNLFKVLNEKEILVSARVEIEEIEKVINLPLRSKEDECDTIGGLVISRIGKIPKSGTIAVISENVRIEVIDSTPRALKKLKIFIS
jgi:CBS domain containing-hemolysin-like protein